MTALYAPEIKKIKLYSFIIITFTKKKRRKNKIQSKIFISISSYVLVFHIFHLDSALIYKQFIQHRCLLYVSVRYNN